MPVLRTPRRLDALFAACVAAVATAETAANTSIAPKAAAWPIELAMAAAMLAVSVAPLAVVVAVAILQVIEAAAGIPLDQPIVPLLASVLAIYTLVAQASIRRALIGAAAMVVALAIETVVQHKGISNFVFGLVFAGAAFAVARVVSHRTTRADELAVRTYQLEQSREADTRRAAQEERARIARELHDVIAHSVSVMVVQAGGAERVLPRDTGAAAEALRSIQATGRQALAEMARLLGILREAGEEVGLAPQPGLSDIAALVSQSQVAEQDVELCVDGDQRALPPGVELAVYRVVQEALTNARKHGGQGATAVHLHYGAREISIEVTNSANGASSAAVVSGHGLIGMRERVTIYDGHLEAGPLPDGRYRIRAEIPLAAQS